MTQTYNPACAAAHLGPWFVDARWLRTAVAVYRAGMVPESKAHDKDEAADPFLDVVQGVAVIGISGPMMKFDSKFGGTNTLRVRQAVRTALRDPSVDALVVQIDSPGGSVAGTLELVEDVRKTSLLMPTFAHIDDMGASAAVWVAVAVGFGHVSINRMGMAGSVGAVAVLIDSSGAFAKEGLKVHVLTSDGADLKAAGADGTEITKEQLAYFQGLIDSPGRAFVSEVARSRNMSEAQVRALRGRMLAAPAAKAAGLVDHVRSFDETMEVAIDAAGKERRARQSASNARQLAR